ncbi:MAG: sigma 54-interacting transcriptional regulator [Planctomycetaceae bacterium]|nr:sigma 54-interacting transcriptional regulator [Planctomycetaceae bacterium]
MPHFTERLLELWKTAGQQTRLEEALPFFVQALAQQGHLNRLLLVRWNKTLEFLEPLLSYSADASGTFPGKQSCDARKMHDFLKKLNKSRKGSPVSLGGDTAVFPEPLLTLFQVPIPDTIYICGVKSPNDSPVFLLIDMQAETQTNSLTRYLTDLAAVICVLLEREAMFRRLSQLREAAKAEKELLLNKLGRRDPASENIVGADRGLQRVLERVELIAATDTPVLILGETGSGKALIARTIHHRSPRATRPFFRFNCGAVLPELIDEMLFGREPPGTLERVDGGTLFLDDIHELPLSAQTHLLRLFKHGILESTDGKKTVPLDVRIIAATDHDLGLRVSESRFLEELWYRLTPFPIRLPTLRERPGDLPELARHFAERTATRFGLPLVLPTEQDIEFLKMYSWPGNVRELGTVIDRAALLGNGKSLDVVTALGVPDRANPAAGMSHVNMSYMSRWPEHAAFERMKKKTRWEAFQTVEPLDEMLRRYFGHVLTVTQGKIEGTNGAAELLQINPNTLRAKLKKLQIDLRKYKKKP